MKATGKASGRAGTFFVALILALWLAAASFMVVLSPPATRLLAELTVDDTNSIHSHEYLVSIAEASRAFCVGDDKAPIPLGDDETVAYTPRVISHLLDVRAVFQAVIVFFLIITVVVVMVLILYLRGGARRDILRIAELRKERRHRLGLQLILGACIPLALSVLIVGIGFLNFDALFIWIHSLFFTWDSYYFAEDSLLIQALPMNFWIGCGILWAVSLVVLCAISTVIGAGLRRRYGNSKPR